MVENKNIFLILIIAIAIAISASFSNNFFAYYFLSHSIQATAKTRKTKLSSKRKPKDIKLKKSWKWSYSEIGTGNNNYPIVALRDGFKSIKFVKDNVLMGWKYELLNTSPKIKYIVTIDYKFEDKDGFLISESSATDVVRPQEIITIKKTAYVPCDDYDRVSGSSWAVKLTPNWKTEKLEGNRFERAGVILKKKSPYWLREYLTYLFMGHFPPSGAKKSFMQILFPHKWIIAQSMNIKPEPMLKDIGDKLNIDFTKYNLPSWKEIISNPNYASLGKKEKEILKKYLGAQKDYGNYSPDTGRKSKWEIIDNFPEPIKPVKETK